jgi:hypothetical protein
MKKLTSTCLSRFRHNDVYLPSLFLPLFCSDPQNILKVPPGVQPGQQVQLRNPRTGQLVYDLVPLS